MKSKGCEINFPCSSSQCRAAMRTIIILCFLTTIVTGCDPVRFRSVALRFPPQQAQGSVSVSANRSEVQEALNVVDLVVTQQGLTLVDISSVTNQPGLVTTYHTPPLKRATDPMIGCGVFLKNNTLSIIFSERGRLSSSDTVRQMCETLHERLSSHYGAERVTVEH